MLGWADNMYYAMLCAHGAIIACLFVNVVHIFLHGVAWLLFV